MVPRQGCLAGDSAYAEALPPPLRSGIPWVAVRGKIRMVGKATPPGPGWPRRRRGARSCSSPSSALRPFQAITGRGKGGPGGLRHAGGRRGGGGPRRHGPWHQDTVTKVTTMDWSSQPSCPVLCLTLVSHSLVQPLCCLGQTCRAWPGQGLGHSWPWLVQGPGYSLSHP